MRVLLLFVIISIMLASCIDFESSEYIAEENKAISDLLFELTSADTMIKWNDYGQNPVLFVNDTLFVEYFQSKDFTYSDSIKRLIEPMDKKEISSRLLNVNFKHDIISVKKFPEERYKKLLQDGYNRIASNEFGLFSCSRIIFNRRYTEGHLIFSFLCGEACGWGGLYSIKKINGKWKKKDEISSWIF